MRSLLFVPGDEAKKLAKAAESGADVLVVDLEDAVTPEAKSVARQRVRQFLNGRERSGPRVYVRVNSLDSGMIDADLDGIMPAAPDGIMLPKCADGRDVVHLGAKLAVREAESGLPDGSTSIIALTLENAAALFSLGSFRGASQRLTGLAWGAEDLATDLGARSSRTADGDFRQPMQFARMACLYGATAAQVAAIDTVHTGLRDTAHLRAECEAARDMGFTAKLAIHPAQVAVINDVFTPTPDEIAEAQQIIEAFAAAPGAAVLSIAGRMRDAPHLKAAQRVIARARRS